MNSATTARPNDLVTTSKVARELHVSGNCVRRWILEGKLSGWRIGRKIFASWAEVQAFRKDIPKPGA